MPRLSIKNFYAETKSLLTEAHEYQTSSSHSHIMKNLFTVDMDIGRKELPSNSKYKTFLMKQRI